MNPTNAILIGLFLVCAGCNGSVSVAAASSVAAKPLFAAANVSRSKLCIYAQRIRGFEGDEYAAILRELVRIQANSGAEFQVTFWPNDPADQLRHWSGHEILEKWDEF